ncbi:MAG: MFS transporter [Bacteroidia bacterium]|nr:MFS transporter [Bacteroidia bacterium]
MKIITKTVWLLSFVSFFTDLASEMLYPVMPIYLKSIGFSVFLIGILEGIAEAVSGLSKGYFGKMSDISQKRLPFVKVGYTLSAISKPLMAVSVLPLWVFAVRTIDRLGKGIRTGARDAILSAESSPKNKAKVFGFHRSVDSFGAVAGPILALIFFYYYPGKYLYLFILAFIPGIFAVLFSFLIKEKVKKNLNENSDRNSFFSFIMYWKNSSLEYKKLVSGMLVFALFNSSDIFLLLLLKQNGFSDTAVISIYIFYNLVFSVFAYPLGILADKIGLKNIFISGLLFFTVVYVLILYSTNLYLCLIVFTVYGIYAACTDGIIKAWISLITPKDEIATAIGTFAGFQSICAMIASSFTGFLWFMFGAEVAFFTTAIFTFLIMIYFYLFVRKPIIGDS